jgi:hypothetical protein
MLEMQVPDVNLTFSFAETEWQDGRNFLNFLRTAARRHSVPISIAQISQRELTLSVPANECSQLDMFLQELVLTKGLYYYLCGISNRRRVAKTVVKPVFEQLLTSRFSVVYPVLLHKHLLQGSPDWTAGDFREEFSQEYERLFQRFHLKMTSGYEFIRDLDDLLTEFMLITLGHKKGDQSPKFNILVDRCGKQDILRNRQVRKLFNRVHSLRTNGLHRLEKEIPDAELSEIAQSVHYVFEWLEEYWEAQDRKTVVFSGKRYRRVRYGDEMRYWERSPRGKELTTNEFRTTWNDIISRPCHDCDAVLGELHLDNCDMEVCPRCIGQFMCCDCWLLEEEDS